MKKMEWQPIETAPRDGTYIFLYEKYSEYPFVGRWLRINGAGEWLADKQHLNTDGDAIVIDWFSQDSITHWMPIMDLPN